MAQQSGAEPGREYSAVRREALTLPMDRPRANDARGEQQTREDTQGDSAAGKAPAGRPRQRGASGCQGLQEGVHGGTASGNGVLFGGGGMF